MADHSRRRFIQGAGLVLGGLALGATPASAGSDEPDRFLVDLQEVDRSDVPDDVEIVHDIGEIDLLAARGDPDAVPGAASTTPDVAVFQDGGGPAKEHPGPDASGAGSSHNHDGTATNTELQWDKRVQDVAGELTDKPGGGKTVHDVTAGEGTRVAVVDSGVYDDHPDLAGVVNADLSANFTTDPYDFRPNGAGDHGTHVAGIVAATNDIDGEDGGVLGTAPETEVVAHRVFSGVAGATGDVLAALVDAANNGCDAANISLGYPYPYVDPEEYPFLRAIEAAYERVAAYARSQDMVIVNSAGNDGLDMDADGVLSLPTEVDGIFGVSATGPIGYGWGGKHSDNEAKWLTGNRLDEPTTQPAKYTNYGSAVDVSAGGGNYDPSAIGSGAAWYNDLVFSTVYETTDDGEPRPAYGWKAGTSMAAPQVAGAVALVRSLRPDASAAAVESLIRETASAAEEGAKYHGAGHLDLEALVKAASKGK
ncbi:MAG: S8 family serine peptidase [Halobacterium sp.]